MTLVTQLKPGTFFEEESNIFEVLSYEHIKMGRGTGNVKVKTKNLTNGAILTKSFITGAKVQEITPQKVKAQFLYSDTIDLHFIDSVTFDQFEISKNRLGESTRQREDYGGQARFLKEGQEVQILVVDAKVLKIELPKIVELKVSQTGASFAGGRETPGTKEAILETGVKIQVPMFVKIGDVVRVNTQTGQYIERAK